MKVVKWIKSLFKKKDKTPPNLVRRKERDFDLVELSTQLDRGKTHMILLKGKAYRVRELGALLLLILFTSCHKQEINLPDVLQSQQWELAYYKVNQYYATEYRYRIQFRANKQIAVFRQSGDVEYGKWETEGNNVLNIDMDITDSMTGRWEMIRYEIWGYDQDRLTFKMDTTEWGIKRW